MPDRCWISLSVLVGSALVLVGPVLPREPGEAVEIKGWGRVIDPDGDCRVFVDEGRLTIAVPARVHALSAERGQTNAPRILREVAGDFIAEVQVSGVSPPDAPSLVPARRPFRAAGLLLWRDDGTYIRLERAGMDLDGDGRTFANFEWREQGRFARVGNANEHPVAGETTHLRLERRGGTVIASVGADGRDWKSLEPLRVDLPDRVRIGVDATHNTSAPFRPRFGGFKLLRKPGRPIEGP